jgi:hypothetical protein
MQSAHFRARSDSELITRDNLEELLRERCGIGVLSTIPNRYAPEGYLLSCGGEDAISFWQKLRDLVDQSGYWPVILGNDKEVTRVLGVADSEYGQPLRQILDEAASQSAEQWLKERDHSHHSSMQRACIIARRLA